MKISEKNSAFCNCITYSNMYTYSSMCSQLCENGAEFSDAAYEVSLIIEYVTGFSRAKILADRDFDYLTLPDGAAEKIFSMIERRVKLHEPLQYILGEWGFMGHFFKVGEGCLIPRPDTELLCEYAIKKIPQNGTFADLCSGSGCIAISVLLERPDIQRAAAVEISPDALKYLRENAENLGVSDRLEIICGDVTEDIFKDSEKSEKFDMIVSNPPYIPAEDVKKLAPELSYEPQLALDGGDDGLDIIRKIIEIYPKHIKSGGEIVIEFGFDQPDAVSRILSSLGYRHTIMKDYGGNSRAVTIII